MLKTTEDLREAMTKLYKDVEDGTITNSQARTRAYVAKTILDTLKVEIAATALGKTIEPLSFAGEERGPQLKRIA